MTLSNAVRQDSNIGVGNAVLASVTVMDKAKQNAEIDIYLFKTSPTLVSSDNAAFDITDANLVAQCIGVITVGTNYASCANNSVSTDNNINVPVEIAGPTSTTVYAVAVVRGTPTYASTSDLVFNFTFYID